MLHSIIKTAWRSLKKNKLYAGLNIVGLAVGLAAALFVVLNIRFETSYDRHHANADRIFRLVPADFTSTPYALGERIKARIPEVEEVAAVKKLDVSEDRILIEAAGQRLGEDLFYIADPSFFRVFSVLFIAGRPDAALSHPQAAVLTESAARRYFGTTECLGRTFRVEGRVELRVDAVVRDLPANSHFKFHVLAPITAGPAILNWDDRAIWGSWNYKTYLLLRKGGAAAVVEPKIAACFPDQIRRNSRNSDKLRLQALTDIHLKSHLRSEFEPNGDFRTILLYSAVGLLILLVSALNFVNLSTAYSLRRCREVGLRKVLGADRRLIIRQFLGESLLLTALAALAALAVLRLGFPFLSGLTGTELRLEDVAWGEIALILAGLTCTLGLAAGAYPAFFASAFQPVRTLKGDKALASRRFPVRSILLVCQFVISFGFVVTSFIVRTQMHYLQTKNLGLDKDRIVNIRLPQAIQARTEELKAELLGNPDIVSAAASNFLSSRETSKQTFQWEGRPAEDDGYLRWIAVDADFLKTYGLSIVDGRGPAAEDESSGEQKFLVNESAVQRLGWKQAVGKQMEIEATFAKPGRVIGVVKDFHFRSLHFPIEPLAFFVTPSRLPFSWKGKTQEYLPFSYISVKLAGSNIPGAVRFIQAFCNRHISDDPGAWSFFDDEFGRMYAAEMKTARVFGGLSLLATLLAGMGVFGLSAFMIERRRKEISIRKVLGAAPGRILYLLSSDFLKLLLIAGVLAVPVVGLAMRRWLDGFAYRIVLGPWYFAGGLAFLTVLLVATVAWHGLRAAWSNTAADLRSE